MIQIFLFFLQTCFSLNFKDSGAEVHSYIIRIPFYTFFYRALQSFVGGWLLHLCKEALNLIAFDNFDLFSFTPL